MGLEDDVQYFLLNIYSPPLFLGGTFVSFFLGGMVWVGMLLMAKVVSCCDPSEKLGLP